MDELSVAAKSTVNLLRNLPRSPERSAHIFNMVQIAERIYCKAAKFSLLEAVTHIESAVAFLRRHGIV